MLKSSPLAGDTLPVTAYSLIAPCFRAQQKFRTYLVRFLLSFFSMTYTEASTFNTFHLTIPCFGPVVNQPPFCGAWSLLAEVVQRPQSGKALVVTGMSFAFSPSYWAELNIHILKWKLNDKFTLVFPIWCDNSSYLISLFLYFEWRLKVFIPKDINIIICLTYL